MFLPSEILILPTSVSFYMDYDNVKIFKDWKLKKIQNA